jgi:hypothetical protein
VARPKRTAPSFVSAYAYHRVSTSEQGRSGLGLEAQAEADETFCEREGIELLGAYGEVETGKGSNALKRRPQLAAAIAAARPEGGGLLDRRRQIGQVEPRRAFHFRPGTAAHASSIGNQLARALRIARWAAARSTPVMPPALKNPSRV